jgi:hypothetical protein
MYKKIQKIYKIFESLARFFIFIFLKIVFYRNIFLVSQFTGLYPYRPSAGRAAPCRAVGAYI